MGDLIQRVQDSVRSQKSNFCSRATSVTLLGSNQLIPFNLVVSYVDCDGNTNTVPYMEVQQNNNYIPDCVQGGCPISITDDNELSYKSFVQYGTTDCEAPPSENNVILQPCNLIGESFIVDPTGYNLTQGGVYNIQLTPLGDNPLVITQCYTVGPQTNQQASYNITGLISNVGDCNMCRRPTPTVTFPTPTPPTFFSYIVGDTSFGLQQDACASSGGGTITVYSDTKELTVNSTFLYGDQQLKTSYNSNGFVYYSGKGNYVLSTGSDGKLTSLAPCT
jgi:hypothetical protein